MKNEYVKLVETNITEEVSNTFKREIENVIKATTYALEAETKRQNPDEEHIEHLKNHILNLKAKIGPDAETNW